MLGGQLVTIHNLHYLTHLMEQIRQAIKEDRYEEFKKEYLAKTGY